MIYSPSTSPPNVPMALFCCAFGIVGMIHGLKVIIQKETKARESRTEPYQIVRGKRAVQIGIGIFVFVGLFWFVLGVITLIYLYHQH